MRLPTVNDLGTWSRSCRVRPTMLPNISSQDSRGWLWLQTGLISRRRIRTSGRRGRHGTLLGQTLDVEESFSSVLHGGHGKWTQKSFGFGGELTYSGWFKCIAKAGVVYLHIELLLRPTVCTLDFEIKPANIHSKFCINHDSVLFVLIYNREHYQLVSSC